MSKLRNSCALLILIGIAACNSNAPKTDTPDILAANLDTTVSPAKNFFLYANGGWIKRTPIPGDESTWGIGNMVQEEIYNRLKTINETAAGKSTTAGSTEQKIGDFWKTGMDSITLNKAALAPLQPDLTLIDGLKTYTDLVPLAANFHTKGVNVMFSDAVYQDSKNSEMMAYQLHQGGLGMPNRDYYFNKDARTEGVRDHYKRYIVKILSSLAAGRPDTTDINKRRDAIFALETRLAGSSRKLADLRDPYRNYNKMNTAGLYKIAPDLDWNIFFKLSGLTGLDSTIVGQPEFFTTLSHEMKTTPIDTWKDYLKVRLVANAAPFLDDKTYNDNFEYFKSLSGADHPRPRWKRVLDAEENAIGEALGQLFVKEYFNETAKKRYTDLVENIRDAYRERIMKLTWMSDSSKQKAVAKLAKITRKVGYPDKWKDFSAMQIDTSSYFHNVQQARIWWHRYDFAKLGKPVDRTEWGMTPQTYNAYYNPSNNEIVLPAGIFAVPGKKDEELDPAFVYGYAAASTIGHEITHGFDDQGRQYDDKGNLKNWWVKSDEDHFKERAEKIIQEFNGFTPVDTMHINGTATQGENIADLGGLLIGLDAFKKTDAYKSNQTVAGLTQLQRYFLGYAYGWMYTERKELLARQVMTDVHSPSQERVNGPMMNIPDFYTAFNVKPGDEMYRADSLRVNIW